MAKKAITIEKPVKTPEKLEEVRITKDNSEADVVRFQGEGRVMYFGSGEDFKPLPDAITSVLSHDNARRYWMALGENNARKRKTEKPMLEQIIDPLVGHEEARLHFGSDGTPEGEEFLKRNWLCWQFCTNASGMKQVGYSEVTDKDPVRVGISSNASGYYLTKDLQGRDELLLMKVDFQKHLQHDRAVAALSQQKIKGARGQFEGDLDKVSRGKVKPMRESEEDQTVEKVRVTRDTVDQAFLQDRK